MCANITGFINVFTSKAVVVSETCPNYSILLKWVCVGELSMTGKFP
jgi:hypothetical protein